MLITYKNDIKRQIRLLAPEGLKQFPLFNSTKIGKSNSDAMEN